MIPKIIHYCWFGGQDKPKLAHKCIESWKKFFPQYEIIEWNENNFNINQVPFVREAYDAKKFAFVSDYARLWCIYNYGGVYFDTDVEVISSMDDILAKGGYMAFERHEIDPEYRGFVNPGLGFAAQKHNPIVQDIMNFYKQAHFISDDGTENKITIVLVTTNILKSYGLKDSSTPVTLSHGLTIYPWEYFCPIEYPFKKVHITPETRTIHHYGESWMTVNEKARMRVGAFFATQFGKVIKCLMRRVFLR